MKCYVPVLLLAAVLSICGGGEGVGQPLTPTPTFEPLPVYNEPELVAELSSPYLDAHPYLTADLLEIFFVSERSGTRDIWSATREAVTDSWNPPYRVDELSSSRPDFCVVVSADGLEAYLASMRNVYPPENFDEVFVSSRADRSSPWSEPEKVEELSPYNQGDHFSRPSYLSQDGLRMYLYRRAGEDWDLFVSGRASTADPFSEPTPLAGVNTLGNEAQVKFSSGERFALFCRDDGMWDIFAAGRSVSGDPLVELGPILGLNTSSGSEQLGYISSDQTYVWFSSNRPGKPAPNNIYIANNLTPTPSPPVPVTPTPTWDAGLDPCLWRGMNSQE